MAKYDKILNYLDIPIQHINDGVLKLMNRRGTGEEIRALFTKLRERLPGLVLRTSLITGLPGEGEEEYEELCNFLREFKIERAGVFPYSPEEGTPAAEMEDNTSEEEKQNRFERLLALQNEITHEKTAQCVGKTFPVLVEGVSKENENLLTGHTDTFKLVHFEGDKKLIGQIVNVRIKSAKTWYMIGEITEKE